MTEDFRLRDEIIKDLKCNVIQLTIIIEHFVNHDDMMMIEKVFEEKCKITKSNCRLQTIYESDFELNNFENDTGSEEKETNMSYCDDFDSSEMSSDSNDC